VARRARAFGLQVHYHNRKRLRPEAEAELEATYWESLDQMVARMDILSINCPHTPSTFHLMNARRLKLMKASAVIINTSRGEVIDENALTRMLVAGELGGAGLDVYEHGTEVSPRLRELPNVVLLPHMGSATVEGRIEQGEKVIINIKTFADGHRPPDQVVPGML
jgi:glyoxylate reductase